MPTHMLPRHAAYQDPVFSRLMCRLSVGPSDLFRHRASQLPLSERNGKLSTSAVGCSRDFSLPWLSVSLGSLRGNSAQLTNSASLLDSDAKAARRRHS